MRLRNIISTSAILLIITSHLSAGVIDFNEIPGLPTLTEDFYGLTGYEWQSKGVVMGFGDLGGPNDRIRMWNIREGGAGHAFTSPLGDDVLVAGDPSGGYFISNDLVIPTSTDGLDAFTVRFDSDQAFVGMNILDIDQGEAWDIAAYSRAGLLLEVININLAPGNADASSTPFEFSRAFADIAQIEIKFGGTAETSGFAFDQLVFATDPSTVPEPGSILLLGCVSLGTAWRRRSL